MYTYHESYIGIQVNYTHSMYLRAFSKLLTDIEFDDNTPEEIKGILIDEPHFLEVYTDDQLTFIQEFLELLIDGDFRIHTAYHGSLDMPLWITNHELDSEYQNNIYENDIEDYCIGIDRLELELRLVRKLREAVRWGIKSGDVWNSIEPYVGKVMVNKSS